MNRIAIFASGSGTNAENLIRYFSQSNQLFIPLVLTENPNAYVIHRAAKLNVPCLVFSVSDLNSGKVIELLQQFRIDYIVLAGFLKLLPSMLVDSYADRIINIHPSLLPKFGGKGMYGLYVHKAVLEAAESHSGITIHLVNNRYDEGEVLFQAQCAVQPDDTPESLAKRIHELEHKHFPTVVEKYILNRAQE